MNIRIGYVNVGVRDLDRSIAFYRDTLGLELIYSAPEHHYAAFDVGGLRFAIAASETDGFTGRPPGNRHTGIGLVVADVDAINRDAAAGRIEKPRQ